MQQLAGLQQRVMGSLPSLANIDIMGTLSTAMNAVPTSFLQAWLAHREQQAAAGPAGPAGPAGQPPSHGGRLRRRVYGGRSRSRTGVLSRRRRGRNNRGRRIQSRVALGALRRGRRTGD